jgi:hypothetical protein
MPGSFPLFGIDTPVALRTIGTGIRCSSTHVLELRQQLPLHDPISADRPGACAGLRQRASRTQRDWLDKNPNVRS